MPKPTRPFGSPMTVIPGCILCGESTRQQRDATWKPSSSGVHQTSETLIVDMATDQMSGVPLRGDAWLPEMRRRIRGAGAEHPVKGIIVHSVFDPTELFQSVLDEMVMWLPRNNIETIEIRGYCKPHVTNTLFTSFISECTNLKVLHIHNAVASQESQEDECSDERFPFDVHWHLNLIRALHNLSVQDRWLHLEHYGSNELGILFNQLCEKSVRNLHLEFTDFTADKMHCPLSEMLGGFASSRLYMLEKLTLVTPEYTYTNNPAHNIIGEEDGFIGTILAGLEQLKDVSIITTTVEEARAPVLDFSLKNLIQRSLAKRSSDSSEVMVHFYSVRTHGCLTIATLQSLQSDYLIFGIARNIVAVNSNGVTLLFSVVSTDSCDSPTANLGECPYCWSWYPAVLEKMLNFGRNRTSTNLTQTLNCGLPECQVINVVNDMNAINSSSARCQGIVETAGEGKASGSVTLLFLKNSVSQYRERNPIVRAAQLRDRANQPNRAVNVHKCIIKVVSCPFQKHCLHCFEQGLSPIEP